MAPGETDIEYQGQGARDDDLVLRKLGHTDIQCLAGLGLRGVECDALDGSLGLHGAQGLLAVGWKEVRWHGHRVYIVFMFVFLIFNVYKPIMSGLDPIPEEDLAWDYYYKLYYDDDEEFVPPENQNYIYTTPMAEGGYDPTTENENPALDIAIDNDDDDTTPPGSPGTPGATSTPYQPGAAYHPGEDHEMTTLPQEQSGVVHGPGEAAWRALKFIFPDALATELEAYYDPKTQRLMVRRVGAGEVSYPLYTKEKETSLERLNPKLLKRNPKFSR